ncbi:uncharacterized protein FOMMEDRAFT_157327 [Fomitiporia mediterranea MF3/22]|uniref:uncharacterized protein n=1 Tax=Fomitiporia mediterranea (strain MF3/22) TaxID=694068 RepID=UPI000440835A|nr:uncharacterized protein FOMMEDRAFT_157327 [Fomitiporia mediterranea MF3/22]EJD02136.1 hypothetical protein FOMMEDRAFT_157327 [Fomitiporia mediterranea MF3/22]
MSTSVSHPLVCAECGRRFSRRCDLKRHALIHKPDAKRYYCAYPGCSHSSLQMCNLKAHYISRHLLYRLFECNFNSCGKSYTDASSLIKHEKKYHGFFRKAQKPYERRTSPSTRLALDPSRFVKGFSEQQTPSSTPSLCYSNGDNLSHVSQSLSPAPVTSPATNDRVQPNGEFLMASASTDDFLHEMIPELFPKPLETVTSCVPPITSSNTWDADFAYPNQEPYPNHLGYGGEMVDSRGFTLFDLFNLTVPLEPPFEFPSL